MRVTVGRVNGIRVSKGVMEIVTESLADEMSWQRILREEGHVERTHQLIKCY